MDKSYTVHVLIFEYTVGMVYTLKLYMYVVSE
jgi:hypothetical protein